MQWFQANNLMVNLSKTCFMQFQSYGSRINQIQVNYNGTDIKETDKVTFLGITLDKYCNWKAHIDTVCKKINKFVYVLNKLRKTSTQHTVLLAYHGYVSSILRYGLLLWGNSTDSVRAFLSQKKCIRYIVGIPPYESCKEYFKVLNILPLPCMYIFEICIFVKGHPELFIRAKDLYPRNTRNSNRLVLDFMPKTELFKRNCYAMCIKIFNKLPISIQELPILQFKKKLKMWLLDNMIYSIHNWINDNNL
ncbi:unnamed protein product [Diatraea saccharalis]|uniref:RNA-directed DNA polymerase from mobile element jockey n=1 Tax=Diatraea saccharalis TaxID=40085 RepID=A0A9N9QTI7_9NEOP|nr:unnamed protein product [Diatraea saccharalis]